MDVDVLIGVSYCRQCTSCETSGKGNPMANGSEDEFFWTELTAAEVGGYQDTFKVFLVQVKSDTELGTQLLVDPLSVFRERIPEMGIGTDSDVRAQVLRVNAEISANPVRRSAVWIVIPGSTTAVGIEYKYKKDSLRTSGYAATPVARASRSRSRPRRRTC